MKINRLILATAFALLPFGASATDIVMNPSLGDVASYSYKVCDSNSGTTAPVCPTPGSITGTVTFTVSFVTPGIENAGATFSITPADGGTFSTFDWTLSDPTTAEIAHGSGQGSNNQVPNDVAVGPGGDYTYTVHFVLDSTSLTSAGWTMVLTTGPATGQVPEPGTLALLALGLIGAGATVRRRKL